MIEIQSVSKRYGKRQALDAVSVQINAGEIALLLGANGAGKSTLLRCLLGITEFEGTIRVAGVNPLVDGRRVRALVGYMPQSGGLHPDLTVEDTIHLYADIRRVPRERCAPLLEQAGLDEHTHVNVGDLSGGLRQRLGFALALLADPHILILDEPTSSLDAASRDWLAATLRALAAEGRTVLVSTHAGQELLAAGDRRIVLEEGRLISDVGGGTGESRQTANRTPSLHAGSVAPLIRKELSDALGNRWLISYAVALAVLGFAAASSGIQSSSGLALQAFGRTTATLMNLCLLLSPLVAVLMGAASVASERERGTLEHLLAQPIARSGLLLAKHVGLLVSLTAATVAGFAPAGILIAWSAGPAVLGHYLLFPAVAALVGAAMAAIGLLVSVSSRSASQAQGAGISVWFGFVLLYDLVLMGSLAVNAMSVEFLSAALLANPVDAARVLGVLSLEPDLYLLGPAGAYLAAQFSRGGAAALLLGALSFWAVAPLLTAVVRFRLPAPRTRKSLRIQPIVSPGEVKVS
jgi:ABC-type multidrug transport system ATPase subunit